MSNETCGVLLPGMFLAKDVLVSEPLTEQLPAAVEELRASATEEGHVELFALMDVWNLAEDTVQEEHPHWFIEYKPPRTVRERHSLQEKRFKMLSREKKRERAIQALLTDWGLDPIRDFAVVISSEEHAQQSETK